MGYLFLIQLMAHHSSLAFVPWINSDPKASDTTTEKVLAQKQLLRAKYDSSINEHVELSNRAAKLRECLCIKGTTWSRCTLHHYTYSEHELVLEMIKSRQKKIDRQTDRIGRHIARLTT